MDSVQYVLWFSSYRNFETLACSHLRSSVWKISFVGCWTWTVSLTLLQSTVRACKKHMINTYKKYNFLNMYFAIHPYSLSNSCISLIWSFTQYLHTISCCWNHMSISLVFSPHTLIFLHMFGPSGQLKSLGMRPTTEDDHPDVVLLNTCSIREKARNGPLTPDSWLVCGACWFWGVKQGYPPWNQHSTWKPLHPKRKIVLQSYMFRCKLSLMLVICKFRGHLSWHGGLEGIGSSMNCMFCS